MKYMRNDPFDVVDEKFLDQEDILLSRVESEYYDNVTNWFFKNLSNKNIEFNKVAEIGCGTGHLLDKCCNELSGKPENYYGLDLSENLIINAKKRFSMYNFSHSNGIEIPFEDETFDLMYIATVLVHTTNNPEDIISEMKRVLKKVVFYIDQDFETALLYPGEKALTRKILNAATDYWSDGWIGRKLHSILSSSGLENIEIDPYVRIDRNFDKNFFLRIKRWVEEYGIDKSEADEWYNYLCSNATNDNFIFSRNFYMVCGTK